MNRTFTTPIAPPPPPSPAPSAAASLLPLGQHAGKPAIPINRALTVIGSRSGSSLQLLSRTVSKTHAVIGSDATGLWIRDLASRAHVHVNGRQIREADLRDGDLITIGAFSFKYIDKGKSPLLNQPDRAIIAAVEVQGGPAPIGFDGRAILIGRKPECDVSLMENSVSNCHAVIFEQAGQRLIRDLDSRTGTYVNGQLIRHSELKLGDTIRIGETNMKLVSHAALAIDDLDDEIGPADISMVREDEDAGQSLAAPAIAPLAPELAAIEPMPAAEATVSADSTPAPEPIEAETHPVAPIEPSHPERPLTATDLGLASEPIDLDALFPEDAEPAPASQGWTPEPDAPPAAEPTSVDLDISAEPIGAVEEENAPLFETPTETLAPISEDRAASWIAESPQAPVAAETAAPAEPVGLVEHIDEVAVPAPMSAAEISVDPGAALGALPSASEPLESVEQLYETALAVADLDEFADVPAFEAQATETEPAVAMDVADDDVIAAAPAEASADADAVAAVPAEAPAPAAAVDPFSGMQKDAGSFFGGMMLAAPLAEIPAIHGASAGAPQFAPPVPISMAPVAPRKGRQGTPELFDAEPEAMDVLPKALEFSDTAGRPNGDDLPAGEGERMAFSTPRWGKGESPPFSMTPIAPESAGTVVDRKRFTPVPMRRGRMNSGFDGLAMDAEGDNDTPMSDSEDAGDRTERHEERDEGIAAENDGVVESGPDAELESPAPAHQSGHPSLERTGLDPVREVRQNGHRQTELDLPRPDPRTLDLPLPAVKAPEPQARRHLELPEPAPPAPPPIVPAPVPAMPAPKPAAPAPKPTDPAPYVAMLAPPPKPALAPANLQLKPPTPAPTPAKPAPQPANAAPQRAKAPQPRARRPMPRLDRNLPLGPMLTMMGLIAVTLAAAIYVLMPDPHIHRLLFIVVGEFALLLIFCLWVVLFGLESNPRRPSGGPQPITILGPHATANSAATVTANGARSAPPAPTELAAKPGPPDPHSVDASDAPEDAVSAGT